jgi:hypothetical protein
LKTGRSYPQLLKSGREKFQFNDVTGSFITAFRLLTSPSAIRTEHARAIAVALANVTVDRRDRESGDNQKKQSEPWVFAVQHGLVSCCYGHSATSTNARPCQAPLPSVIEPELLWHLASVGPHPEIGARNRFLALRALNEIARDRRSWNAGDGRSRSNSSGSGS